MSVRRQLIAEAEGSAHLAGERILREEKAEAARQAAAVVAAAEVEAEARRLRTRTQTEAEREEELVARADARRERELAEARRRPLSPRGSAKWTYWLGEVD